MSTQSPTPSTRLRRWLIVACAITLVTAGCGSSGPRSGATPRPTPQASGAPPHGSATGSARLEQTPPAPAPSATPTPAPHLRLVAIGDSIARANSCSGCTDFVDLYGQAISAAVGMPVDVENRAAAELSALPPVEASALLNDVLVDGSLRQAIAQADIVVVNVGFNDTPWNRFDNPCGASDLEATVVRWDRITPACIARVSNEYAQVLDQILTQIDELRGCFTPPGQPADFCKSVHRNATLLRLVTVYDDWIGEAGAPASAVARSAAADLAFVDAQCWVVAEHGGQCADAYHALNGAQGTADAAAFLADDHTHLNQRGHQLIAATLAKLGFAPLP